MQLTSADVDRYGPLYDCRPPCEDGITVLSGPNEAGKTLYLEAMLQLLEPDVANLMNPAPRVDQEPTGRVVVETGGDQYECDGDTSLCDISAIEPSHLQSVFVVRDNDLQLPSEQEYYASLIEKLGDIHTTEINVIDSELKERGRLTDTRLNVSSDQAHDHAGTVRDNAETLAEEIREYAQEIEEEGVDELETQRLRLKRDFQEKREKLKTQRKAKKVAEYDRLSGQLETYRSTSDQLSDLAEFDRGTLDGLRQLRDDIERDREELEARNSDIEQKEKEIEEIGDKLEELEERQSKLERRETAVDDARSTLEMYRDRKNEVTDAERKLSLAKYATVSGLLAAGASGVAGAITGSLSAVALGIALLLAAVGGGISYRVTSRRLAEQETAREDALQSARDAGFDVSTVEDVAPAIESYEDNLSHIRERVAKTEQEQDDSEETLADYRSDQNDLESQIEEQTQELEEMLDAADVDSIDKYEQQVETRETLEPERRSAKQSLVETFDEPDVEGPGGKADSWAEDLDELIADVNREDIDAQAHDRDTLQKLEETLEELQRDLEEVQERLEKHDDKLDNFDDRVRALTTQPFVGQSLGLDARSKEGLQSLAADLDEVVEEIEEDAELSRKALKLFGRIEEEEEQKLADLFDPAGPASETFEQLTNGRYTEVAYDADTHEIVVERRDERTFTPNELSQGTTDQLYFATRVSLAQQLLGNEPGFLLLDDPFLAADPDRLRQGFEMLRELANDGWQILYLTAKQEVSETMVNEYGLDLTEIEPAPLNS